jgi:hypothetical protein
MCYDLHIVNVAYVNIVEAPYTVTLYAKRNNCASPKSVRTTVCNLDGVMIYRDLEWKSGEYKYRRRNLGMEEG